MSDDEDEVKLEPRPLTPPQVDSNVFKNAAFGNMNTLRFLVDGEAAAPAAVEEGEEGEDAKGEEEKTDAATGLEAVDLNARDEFGATALCWACRNGALPSVEYLVAKGANIESAGYGEMRPLHFAANFAREKVVKLLLKNGADVDAKDGGGNTPLHWAGAKGVLTVVTLLVEAGAGLMASNNSGATPLHKAANGGHISIVRKLLDSGANVVVADQKGNTALHVAAASGFVGVVKELLARGAKVTRNKAGKSCVDVAATKEIIELLEAASS